MIRKGSRVKWKWGNGIAEGKVKETFTDEVTKTKKGNKVTATAKKVIKRFSLSRRMVAKY